MNDQVLVQIKTAATQNRAGAVSLAGLTGHEPTAQTVATVQRAPLELIADGKVEAFWRDPAHRTGLMFRAVDR